MSTDVTSVTAVEWAWRSDQKWESFPDAVNLKLENAYGAGKDKLKVDKERFVDLSMKVCCHSFLLSLPAQYIFGHPNNGILSLEDTLSLLFPLTVLTLFLSRLFLWFVFLGLSRLLTIANHQRTCLNSLP
jgi:hypothetical protein